MTRKNDQTHCAGCGKRMRPNRTLLVDHPGTVAHACHGLCAWCYKVSRRPDNRAMPPNLAPDEWGRLPGGVKAYLTERRRRLAA